MQSRWRSRSFALLLACATATAQEARVRAVFAASEHRNAVPGIAWLCEDYLPGLPSWPAELDPLGAFSVTVTRHGVRAAAADVAPPSGAVAIGAVATSEDPNAPALLWRCGRDGREEWMIPAAFTAPEAWQETLRSIEADVVGTPRSLALPVLAGHLSCGLAEGDPRAPLLRIGPALCGDVTWITAPCDEGVSVRGCSGGGLMLPLVILMAASTDSVAAPDALQLRAFAGRDGDRVEALRQLARADRALDAPTLCAGLFGDDIDRMTAIRALTRRGAADELPRILDAAISAMPLATAAAIDAVDELWGRTTATVRDAVRRTLRLHENTALRDLDVDARTAGRAHKTPQATELDLRGRAWVVLTSTGVALLGLWNRARARMRATLS